MYSAEPTMPLGRYRLIALLGQGGMADVYLACTQGPRGFQKLLVVKLARFTGDPVFATMFLEEARIAAQLEHPNVVQTYEIAEEGTRHYIVMEFLDGGNLSRLRQRSAKTGGVPLRTSLTILAQALEGLEYAHEARGLDGRELKVVHRDLSPSNIMVTSQGVVKILDFGIAKATDSYSFTQTGKFSGKLSYMPPEQLRGVSADARADLFAFGVILAEAALNEKMWGNTGGAEIASKLGNNEIPSLDRGKPIDPELRAICERALAPDREQRYGSAAELRADLTKYLASLGGPISQKELAQFVRDTVGDDRAKLQEIIDSQLQRLSAPTIGGASGSWTSPSADVPRVELRTPTSHDLPKNDTVASEVRFEDSGQVQIITSEPASVAPTVPPRPKAPMKLLILIGTLLALTLVLVIVLIKTSSSPAPIQSAPVAPVEPPPSTNARLEIVASPSEARLTLDGKPLDANPYVGAFARDTQVHELVISAPGYQSLTHRFALDRDLNLHLNLLREAAPAAAIVVEPPHVAVKQPVQQPPRKVVPPAKVVVKQPVKVETKPDVKPETKVVETKVEAKVDPKQPGLTKATPPTTKPTVTTKHTIDTDIYTKSTTKRTLDPDALDGSGSAKSKPAIDRNPWTK